MKNTEKKNKHLTLEDRIEIQECLQKGMTFKAISKRIGKDTTYRSVDDENTRRYNYVMWQLFRMSNCRLLVCINGD